MTFFKALSSYSSILSFVNLVPASRLEAIATVFDQNKKTAPPPPRSQPCRRHPLQSIEHHCCGTRQAMQGKSNRLRRNSVASTLASNLIAIHKGGGVLVETPLSLFVLFFNSKTRVMTFKKLVRSSPIFLSFPFFISLLVGWGPLLLET